MKSYVTYQNGVIGNDLCVILKVTFAAWNLSNSHTSGKITCISYDIITRELKSSCKCTDNYRTAEGSFLFVYEISQEALNGFAPNTHGRRFWSLARTNLKVKVKGQGHQGQKRNF